MIAAFSPSIEIPSGLQRLHGRKPVALAAASVSCSWTFLRFAVRDGQDGRQYIPVVATEYQKQPSAVLSRATIRAQRGSSAISGGMLGCGLSSVMVMSVHFVVGAVGRSCRRAVAATLRSLLSNPIGPRAKGKGLPVFI